MNIDSFQASLNSTLQVFVLYFEQFAGVVLDVAAKTKRESENFTRNWQSPIEFTPLQVTLLKVLLCLLFGTGALIACAWYVYGKVITDKFVKASTLKEIEELKLSVAKLKLPKEHSPRI